LLDLKVNALKVNGKEDYIIIPYYILEAFIKKSF